MENKALKNKKFFDLYKYIFSYIMAASLPLVIVIVIFGTVFTQAYQREVEANQSSSLLSAQPFRPMKATMQQACQARGFKPHAAP